MGSFDGTSAEQLRSAVMGTPSVTAAVEASGWTPSRIIPKVVERSGSKEWLVEGVSPCGDSGRGGWAPW
jgi:hypothetical protein